MICRPVHQHGSWRTVRCVIASNSHDALSEVIPVLGRWISGKWAEVFYVLAFNLLKLSG